MAVYPLIRICLPAIAACVLGAANATRGANTGVHPAIGSWQEITSGESLVCFEPSRIRIWQNNHLMIGKVLALAGEDAVIFLNGHRMALKVHAFGDSLTLRIQEPGQTPDRYHRIARTPEVLLPIRMPAGSPLDATRIDTIGKELRERVVEDQAVRLDPSRAADLETITKENTGYLTSLVQVVGWIDATRFEAKTSSLAFLLVQHSNDLRLMMAVLPLVEEDVLAGRLSPEAFVLLYDRTQIMTGEKQRFGSQAEFVNGKAVPLPLEDADRVDDLRAELGLPPLAEYLVGLEKMYRKPSR